MNKQMTPAEIDVVCGRSATSVKEKFTRLDKFDTLLGPNEESISPHNRLTLSGRDQVHRLERLS